MPLTRSTILKDLPSLRGVSDSERLPSLLPSPTGLFRRRRGHGVGRSDPDDPKGNVLTTESVTSDIFHTREGPGDTSRVESLS